MEDLNYFWVGPPASGQYSGHDTIGVDLMSEAHPELGTLHFWCLKEHQETYQGLFDDKHGTNKIKVHALEEIIKAEEEEELTKFFVDLLKTARNAKSPSDRARDFTTIKALSQFLCSAQKKGIYLDSNIVPNPEYSEEDLSKIEIPGLGRPLEKFMIPFVADEHNTVPDPWCMFSPAEEAARERFKHYFKEAAEEFESRKEGKIDRVKLATAFVTTAVSSDPVLWKVPKRVDTVELGPLRKRYYNTHKQEEGVISPPLMHWILTGVPAAQEFNYMLNLRQETNPSDCYEYGREGDLKKISLLHLAAGVGKALELSAMLALTETPLVKIILKAEKDARSPFQTAIEFNKTACIEVYLEHFVKKKFEGEKASFLKTLNEISQLVLSALKKSPIDYTKVDLASLAKTVKDIDSLEAMLIEKMGELGPVTEDNIPNYTDCLKKYYFRVERERQNEYDKFGFEGFERAVFPEAELSACLEQLRPPVPMEGIVKPV
jgi:hypothetical protein